MIRQLLLIRAVAVTLCRTGLLFDVPFAVYIYNGSALITWVLETGPNREELRAHHIHHLTSMVGGAVLLRTSLSTAEASMQDLEGPLPSGGHEGVNTVRDVLLIWGSAGIVFLMCDAQRISCSLTMTPGYQLKDIVFPEFEHSQGVMGSSHSHKIIF